MKITQPSVMFISSGAIEIFSGIMKNQGRLLISTKEVTVLSLLDYATKTLKDVVKHYSVTSSINSRDVYGIGNARFSHVQSSPTLMTVVSRGFKKNIDRQSMILKVYKNV